MSWFYPEDPYWSVFIPGIKQGIILESGQVGILCLWNQVLLSVHSAHAIFFLCFSGPRYRSCSLENDCACMNCIGHESSTSGLQVKAAWLGCVTLHITDSPLWHFPCPAWSHTRCATCLASLSRVRLMQAAGCCNLSGKQEAHGSSGTLQNREKHSLKQPWVRPAVRTSPPGVYSSLLRAWQQRTRPLQISPDLGGREPQER